LLCPIEVTVGVGASPAMSAIECSLNSSRKPRFSRPSAMTRWRKFSEIVAPEAVLDEVEGLRSARMNDDCGETIEAVEQHGSFVLIRTGPRFAVVEQRADRVYPIPVRRARGRAADAGGVGYCGGRSRLALRGGSAAVVPGALRSRRPDRAIASVAITRRRALQCEAGRWHDPPRRREQGRIQEEAELFARTRALWPVRIPPPELRFG